MMGMVRVRRPWKKQKSWWWWWWKQQHDEKLSPPPTAVVERSVDEGPPKVEPRKVPRRLPVRRRWGSREINGVTSTARRGESPAPRHSFPPPLHRRHHRPASSSDSSCRRGGGRDGKVPLRPSFSSLAPSLAFPQEWWRGHRVRERPPDRHWRGETREKKGVVKNG